MHHAEHTVTVDAPVDLVWEVLVDVEGYPAIFPPTQGVEILQSRPGQQIVRLDVEVNGEIVSWTSQRDIDAERRVIAYRQLETAPIVQHMAGDWRAFPFGPDRTQLVLTHDFAARVPPGGQLDLEQADRMLLAAVERNSTADIEAVKGEAERRVGVAVAS
jgi:aromatase